MDRQVIEVKLRAIVRTANGHAVFLGNSEKTFVIYIDATVGLMISMVVNNQQRERPLTHDLFINTLIALGARVDRVIINDIKSDTYFARLILSAENEIHSRKIVEIDARPSDCVALALLNQAPIYVTRTVWNEVNDHSETLRQLEAGEIPEPPSEGL